MLNISGKDQDIEPFYSKDENRFFLRLIGHWQVSRKQEIIISGIVIDLKLVGIFLRL